MTQLSPAHRWVSFWLILSIGIVEVATDIYIPSLPQLTRLWNISDEWAGLTISAYLVGLCLSGPIYGPWSDMHGRRPIFLLGIGLFALFSFACCIAPTIELLILGRFLQGMGAGVAWVVGLALIKDCYNSRDSVRIISQMGFVIAVAPAIAPVLGGYLGSWAGWRAPFALVAFMGMAVWSGVSMFLPETLPAAQRQFVTWGMVLRNYIELLKRPSFMVYSLLSALPFSALWAYVYTAPFLFIEHLQTPVTSYGYYQMALVVLYMVGSYVNRRLMTKYSSMDLLKVGLVTMMGASISLMGVSYFSPYAGPAMTCAMAFYCMGLGFVYANTSVYALEVLPQLKGASSALLGAIEMGCAALAVLMAGLVYEKDLWPVALLVFCITGVAGALALWGKKYVSVSSR